MADAGRRKSLQYQTKIAPSSGIYVNYYNQLRCKHNFIKKNILGMSLKFNKMVFFIIT